MKYLLTALCALAIAGPVAAQDYNAEKSLMYNKITERLTSTTCNISQTNACLNRLR